MQARLLLAGMLSDYGDRYSTQHVSSLRPDGSRYLYGLRVIPEFRGQGRAHAILRQVTQDADAEGTILKTHIHVDRHLVPFFKQYGFVEQGPDQFGLLMVRQPQGSFKA